MSELETPENLSVFGLGKLGATMVGCFASKGFNVIGVDVNQGSVKSVNAGKSPVAEPGLQELYDVHGERISATMDSKAAVHASDASFIIVPTPSLPSGEFFTTIASEAASQIGRALADKDGYHLVVLTSTVLPGATQRDIQSALEEASGKQCGRDIGLCYSPEFIAIGDVINGLLHPDYFLVGEIDDRSGATLENIYRAAGDAETPIQRMSIPNAELTKIAVNSYVTMKISYANTICRICSRLESGDAHVVTRALGMDRRIGGRYLSPGATFGGPCFPRDNRALEWFARSIHEDAPLARATDDVNAQQVDFLIERLLAAAPKAKTVGILGLSYKPKTNLMEKALGVELSRSLIGRGLSVRAYDPWVAREGTTEDVEGLELASSLDACVAGADVAVLATTHEEFDSLTPDVFEVNGRSIPLIDVWGVLRDRGFDGREGYVVPGCGPR